VWQLSIIFLHYLSVVTCEWPAAAVLSLLWWHSSDRRISLVAILGANSNRWSNISGPLLLACIVATDDLTSLAYCCLYLHSSDGRCDISDMLLLAFTLAMDNLTSASIANSLHSSDGPSDISSTLLLSRTVVMRELISLVHCYCPSQ
jgi:hypothetical protein